MANTALWHFLDGPCGRKQLKRFWGVDESLGVEDLNEDTGPGGGVGLSHDVLDVFFDGLFSNLKRIGNFFVGPSFSEVFHH